MNNNDNPLQNFIPNYNFVNPLEEQTKRFQQQQERQIREITNARERKEAEELAKLSEQEKQKKLFEKQVKEIEETKKQLDDLLKRKPDVKETGELGESKRVKSKKSLRENSIGNELAKYQKWVDYDMKRYGKISDKTKEELKDVGLELVKDQYGDYEVIAKDK